MEPTIAYLARGQLFVRKPGQSPTPIESPFAQQTMEREARDRQLHGWKNRSGVWGQMGMSPPEWNQWNEQIAPRRRIHFSAIARAPDGHLFYALDMGHVGGLFHYDLSTGLERRLMHREGFQARDLTWDPGQELFAFSTPREDGTIGISLGENEGRRLRHMTGGDSVDQAPSWATDGSRRLIYQSAAVVRDPHGFAQGLSEFLVESMDVQTHDVQRLFEQTGSDCLTPRMGPDGSLYFIRRPYQVRPRTHDLLTVAQDVVLFPFRFVRAVFHFFNFFSMMFSGKPLATASGPQRETQQERFMQVWGHMIDTRRALADSQRKGERRSLVPRSWELVRLADAEDESPDVLHGNTLCFDLCPGGGHVHSDGTRVIFTAPDGQTQTLCEDFMIEQVVVLEPLQDGDSDAPPAGAG